MAEINNNIPNFGFKKIDKISTAEPTMPASTDVDTQAKEQTIVPDPGVLGRSQVKRANGGNISKTIDETCNIANNNPALMGCCEGVFNTVYNDLVAGGMNESDAYMQALLAEEELLEICPHN